MQTSPTPSNLFAGMSRKMQLMLLKADMKSIRSTRGPLRKQGGFVRAHFINRLIDAKRAA